MRCCALRGLPSHVRHVVVCLECTVLWVPVLALLVASTWLWQWVLVVGLLAQALACWGIWLSFCCCLAPEPAASRPASSCRALRLHVACHHWHHFATCSALAESSSSMSHVNGWYLVCVITSNGSASDLEQQTVQAGCGSLLSWTRLVRRLFHPAGVVLVNY